MSRIMPVLLCVLLLAIAGAPGAFAQAGCQPTIMQPCAKPQTRPNGSQTLQRAGNAKTDDSNEPIDHSPRLKLDRDTDFKFGTGGIGLGRKF